MYGQTNRPGPAVHLVVPLPPIAGNAQQDTTESLIIIITVITLRVMMLMIMIMIMTTRK